MATVDGDRLSGELVAANGRRTTVTGVRARGRHEVQVQDDHSSRRTTGATGGIYGQGTPTSQAPKPAGEWQSFVITPAAPARTPGGA